MPAFLNYSQWPLNNGRRWRGRGRSSSRCSRGRSAGTQINSLTECKYGPENNRKENQSQCESDIFSERKRYPVNDDDPYNYIHNGDQEQKEPPPGFTHDLKKHDDVVDRDQDCPSGLACFGKDDPVGNDHQNTNGKTDYKRNYECSDNTSHFSEFKLPYSSGFSVSPRFFSVVSGLHLLIDCTFRIGLIFLVVGRQCTFLLITRSLAVGIHYTGSSVIPGRKYRTFYSSMQIYPVHHKNGMEKGFGYLGKILPGCPGTAGKGVNQCLPGDPGDAAA